MSDLNSPLLVGPDEFRSLTPYPFNSCYEQRQIVVARSHIKTSVPNLKYTSKSIEIVFSVGTCIVVIFEKINLFIILVFVVLITLTSSFSENEISSTKNKK